MKVRRKKKVRRGKVSEAIRRLSAIKMPTRRRGGRVATPPVSAAELERRHDAAYAVLVSQADLDAVWPAWAAARFLNVKPMTLAGWRRCGTGPKYVSLSRIKVGYRRRSLVAYLETREVASTAGAVALPGSRVAVPEGSNPPVAASSSRE